MISYIRGEIILKQPGFMIIKSGGIGFEVFVSEKTLLNFELGAEAEVFSYLDVGERSLRLFGFLTYRELELFKALRDISGVGPKTALDISSITTPDKIRKEIMAGNEKILDDVPGIGPKKAKKIILELSGKLSSSGPRTTASKNKEILTDEAAIALQNLGFKIDDIKRVLSEIPENKETEEKVSLALKILGRK